MALACDYPQLTCATQHFAKSNDMRMDVAQVSIWKQPLTNLAVGFGCFWTKEGASTHPLPLVGTCAWTHPFWFRGATGRCAKWEALRSRDMAQYSRRMMKLWGLCETLEEWDLIENDLQPRDWLLDPYVGCIAGAYGDDHVPLVILGLWGEAAGKCANGNACHFFLHFIFWEVLWVIIERECKGLIEKWKTDRPSPAFSFDLGLQALQIPREEVRNALQQVSWHAFSVPHPLGEHCSQRVEELRGCRESSNGSNL